MIYTLEMPYNQGLYIQWSDMLKSTGLEFNNLLLTNDSLEMKWDDFLSHKINIDYINSHVTEEDTLLMDSYFISPLSDDNDRRIKILSDSINCKQIIIFHPDTGFSRHSADGHNGDSKVKILTPIYNKNWDTEKMQNKYNFYLCNGAYQGLRWLSEMVFNRYKDMLRYKKFVSHNGVYKGHRTLLYDTLVQNDLLKDTFFSYNAYNIFDTNISGPEDVKRETDYEYHMGEILYESNINDLEKIYSRERHQELLTELPIVLDYIPNLSNVDQYAFTLPYTCNSYIEIIGCTALHGWEEIYTSEKIFKPFMSFQIPIFIGQSGLIKTLKTLGFKMFDNVIDNSYDDIENNLERVQAVCEEIKRLGSLSREQIHNLYWDYEEEFKHNSRLMKELFHKQRDNLINLINGN